MHQDGQEKESLNNNVDPSAPSGEPSRAANVRCKYCDEAISSRAKICQHCQKPQIWWRIPPLELASPIGILIALGLLVLGAFQYRDARSEKIEASVALKQASEALKQASAANMRASSAEAKLNSQKEEINRYAEDLFSSLCRIGSGIFNTGTFSCQLPDGTEIKYAPVFRDVKNK